MASHPLHDDYALTDGLLSVISQHSTLNMHTEAIGMLGRRTATMLSNELSGVGCSPAQRIHMAGAALLPRTQVPVVPLSLSVLTAGCVHACVCV